MRWGLALTLVLVACSGQLGGDDMDDTDDVDTDQPSVEYVCDDEIDDDGDGATDCEDEDCADDPACETD